MATKTHSQPFGNYPENFNKREARLVACGHSQLTLAAAETYTMTSDDGFTHATINGTSGTTTLNLPLAAANIGRLLVVNVLSAAGTVNINTSTGSSVIASAGVGRFPLYCDGTTWSSNSALFSVAKTATVTTAGTLTMTATDGITHIGASAPSGTATIRLPLVTSSYSRLVSIYVSDSTGTVALQTSTGATVVADLAAGSYQYVCDGATWTRFF